MKRANISRRSRIFILIFVVLTFFCWCPVFYASYGPAKRVLGVPLWAVLAAGFGAVLFVVEWIYLFATRITVTDEELGDIVSQLEQVDTDDTDSGREEN